MMHAYKQIAQNSEVGTLPGRFGLHLVEHMHKLLRTILLDTDIASTDIAYSCSLSFLIIKGITFSSARAAASSLCTHFTAKHEATPPLMSSTVDRRLHHNILYNLSNAHYLPYVHEASIYVLLIKKWQRLNHGLQCIRH